MNTQNLNSAPVVSPRRALIISFDFARDRDLYPSYAVASLLAYLRSHPEHGRRFTIEHHGVLLDLRGAPSPEVIATSIAESVELRRLDVIALGAYVWSEALLSPLMRELRRRTFRGEFALGGYQITQDVEHRDLYPDARYLIEGPGERALLRLLLAPPRERLLDDGIGPEELVSPYLTSVIEIPHNAPMVRMETQRGCRWRCTFCSYRGLREHALVPLSLDRVRAELELFAERGVRKINVIDPEFNGRRQCLDVLRSMVDLGLTARVSVQARPENLVRFSWAPAFLDLCQDLNICLEFGLQTAIQVESDAVNRENDYDRISRALYEVSRRGIDCEVSLIYGLPHQTVASFARTLDFVRGHGVETIRCFPLMLTRGTQLSRERDRFGLVEEVVDAFGIPFVTSSSSFTRSDWDEMRRMADAASAGEHDTRRASPLQSAEVDALVEGLGHVA